MTASDDSDEDCFSHLDSKGAVTTSPHKCRFTDRQPRLLNHLCRVNCVSTSCTCGRPRHGFSIVTLEARSRSKPPRASNATLHITLTNSRNFVVPVTLCSPCHHHHTTVGLLLRRDSRHRHDPNRRRVKGDPPRSTLLLNSTSFPCGLLIPFGIPFVSVRKLHKHNLHVTILTGPLFVEGLLVAAIVTPELGFVQIVVTTSTQLEKLDPYTIVATTLGLILIRASNVLQELYQCISTIPCIPLHQPPQLISRRP